MAPRLHHKKSRTGCTRCKRRRVKCDEEQPVCSACKRHNVACEYPVLTICRRSPSSPSNPFPSPSSSSSKTHPNDADIPLPPEQRRLLELHLLQHFTSAVARSFPAADDDPTIDMWCNHVVGMAFEHPFLLNSIFSLAALHLDLYEREPQPLATSGFQSAMQDPRCPVPPARAHGMYFNAAAKQQREALATVSAHNGNALWMTTIVLSLQAIALARFEDDSPPEDGEEPRGGYRSPLHWLRMVRGITEMEATVRPFAQRPVTLLDFVVEKEPSSAHSLLDANGLDFEYPKIFAQLAEWEQHYGPDPEPFARETYDRALDFIRMLYRCARGGNPAEIFRHLLRPDAITTPQFLMFIEARRPRAYVTLACYCTMTMAADGHWIFRGMARREVRGIQGLLAPQWQWAMEWPLAVISAGKVA
jgi:hypothetical protein